MGYFKSRSRSYYRNKRIIKICILIIIILLIYFFFFNNFESENDSQTNQVELLTMLDKQKSGNLKDTKPTIYIYNTHQREKYKYEKVESYNIDYNVMLASYILKWNLGELGLNSLVETSSISETIKNNDLKSSQSYKASRILMEKAKKKNPELSFFIDVHRDSSVYEKTTCEIDGVKYAKILFVVGLEHDNYEKNLELATTLNNRLKRINPCLSRGIYKKSGKGVNGIYNQDYSPNTILIEVGGQYNTIDEASRILKVMASILYEYIMEDT